ncbi:winged helix-turn-helix transcriptional regulator [Methanoregula sp.]|uniref:winged helix-turn-helix transcriptional regulator n=1 Tax=Methanoregula sp. TaxID=2052170 RepID=UPI003563F535
MKERDVEGGKGAETGTSIPANTRQYLTLAACGLFLGFCLLELVYIPLFGVDGSGIPVPRWQMRPVDLFLHLVHSLSPVLVRPAGLLLLWGFCLGFYFNFRLISDRTVLGFPNREKVFRAIVQEPGSHFNALRDQTGINRGTLRYHLATLVLNGKISCVRDGVYTRYVPAGLSTRERDKQVACRYRDETDRAILSYLLIHRISTQQEIASGVDRSPSVISWRINRLHCEEIVTIQSSGRANRVSLTPEAGRSLRKIGETRNPGNRLTDICPEISGIQAEPACTHP